MRKMRMGDQDYNVGFINRYWIEKRTREDPVHKKPNKWSDNVKYMIY